MYGFRTSNNYIMLRELNSIRALFVGAFGLYGQMQSNDATIKIILHFDRLS